MNNTTFGQYLKAKRKEAHVTQRDLATRCDIDHTYISKLEHDALPPPSMKTLQRIAQVLGTDIKEMVRRAGKDPASPANWATILDVIEAGIEGDTRKCRAYAELLLERSPTDSPFARHLKHILEGRSKGAVIYLAESPTP